MKHFSLQQGSGRNRSDFKRGGFTLVEILVAVAIMSLLLAIILVPLRLGFETYHIGTARSSLQTEVQLTMQQMEKDFRRANFVFPNARIPGISDNNNSSSSCSLQPYVSHAPGTNADWRRLPYIKSTVQKLDTNPATSGIGITNPASTLKPISNQSRIDMLMLRRATNSNNPSQDSEDYVVTYYPRRVRMNVPYDAIDNPIVLFRAQYPYRRRESSGVQLQPAPERTTAANAQIDWRAGQRGQPLGSVSNDDDINRSYLWITHNYLDEANLETLCSKDAMEVPSITGGTVQEDVIASHTLVTPRGMQLIAPAAAALPPQTSYMPELSFAESSSDGKRIDRVTVSMTLAQYDSAGAAAVNGQGKAQRVAVSQTFDLPNASCSN